MSEFTPSINPEQLQRYDEEALVSAIAINETGADNLDDVYTAREKIRKEAIDSDEYYAALRESAAAHRLPASLLGREIATSKPFGEMTDDEVHAALEKRERLARADARTREVIKDIHDPSIPREFPRPAANEDEIPRDFDTMNILDDAFMHGLSPTPQALKAAHETVERIRREHASGARVRGGFKDRPAAEGADAVAAYKELWDAEDKLDMLTDDPDEDRRNVVQRVAQLTTEHRRNPNETNRALLYEARSRRASFSARRDAAIERHRALLAEANQPHRHAQERVTIHEGNAEGTDSAYKKALTKRDNLRAEQQRIARQERFNPASAALAEIQDKLQRAEDALEAATSNRNDNREAVEVATSIFNSLPGLVSREKLEREIGSLETHEDAMTNAIVSLLEAETMNSNDAHHELFVAAQGIHEYLAKIDERLAEMEPDHLSYRELVEMRAEALRSVVKTTHAAEFVKIRKASLGGSNPFGGRFESRARRDGGILIERANGNTVVYADGSFACLDSANKLDRRMNPDGSYWKEGQASDETLFGNFDDEVARAGRYLSKDKNVRARERATITDHELEDLDRDIFEAWLFNQEKPEIAVLALSMTHDQYQRNIRELEHTPPTDLRTRFVITAENNALEYDGRVIDAQSLKGKHGRKGDYLDPNGRFIHQGEHYGRKGNWMAFADGSLEIFTFDSDNRMVVLDRFDPAGQRRRTT